MMVYGSQKGRGFNDIFGTLTSTFKPIAEGAANVGASLATGLVTDLLSGKTPKTSIKERGKPGKRHGCPTCITKPSRWTWGCFTPVVWVGAIKQQNVNEVVQKVNLQRNVNRKKPNRGYLSPYSLSSWELS